MGSDGDAPMQIIQRDALLKRAQEGDVGARNQLVAEFTPFILKAASRVTGRYITRDDDELSVGMMAVNEAVDIYDARRGSFLALCELVVRRRLIDYYRREKMHSAVDLVDTEADLERLDTQRAEIRYEDQMKAWEVREEIGRYRMELRKYGLKLSTVAAVCPRHADARKRAQSAARMLVDDDRMRAYLIRTRKLPLRELTGKSGLSRRTLERQRQYVIAIAVILLGDYPHLIRYVQ